MPGYERTNPTWVDAALALAGQIFSIVSAVIFLSALALNSAVFSKWGLNFLQLASFTDVIMSGIAFIGRMGFMASLILAGFIYALYKEDTKTIAICAIFFIAKIFVYSLGFFFVPIRQIILPVWPIANGVAALAVGAFAGCLYWMVRHRDSSVRMLATRLGSAALFVAFNGVMLIAWEGHQTIESLSRNGFNPKAEAAKAVEGCVAPASVMWIGDRATVYRCGPASSTYYAVSLHGEGEMFKQPAVASSSAMPTAAATTSPADKDAINPTRSAPKPQSAQPSGSKDEATPAEPHSDAGKTDPKSAGGTQ